MKKARYIVLEGTEGVGKTTQTQKLADHLKAKGFKVLVTKEPGTPLSPLTMEMRGLMLDKQYDEEMTVHAREFISQAIRSVHIEKIIRPALENYDYIIQDRGILSGLAYGTACGNDENFLERMSLLHDKYFYSLYDAVLYLQGDVSKGLETALNSKQEFEAGDAMEAKGSDFLTIVKNNMDRQSKRFNTVNISVDGKDIETVFNEMLVALDLPQ
jgi:dTMP kinase